MSYFRPAGKKSYSHYTMSGIEHILKELPDTENIPSEEDIIYNLQGLIGFFIMKDMKKAGRTVYWAEQILRHKMEETGMSDIITIIKEEKGDK